MTQHFNERVATPDAATWQLFAQQASDQVTQVAHLEDGVLDILLLTIDSL